MYKEQDNINKLIIYLCDDSNKDIYLEGENKRKNDFNSTLENLDESSFKDILSRIYLSRYSRYSNLRKSI